MSRPSFRQIARSGHINHICPVRHHLDALFTLLCFLVDGRTESEPPAKVFRSTSSHIALASSLLRTMVSHSSLTAAWTDGPVLMRRLSWEGPQPRRRSAGNTSPMIPHPLSARSPHMPRVCAKSSVDSRPVKPGNPPCQQDRVSCGMRRRPDHTARQESRSE